jgi:hypothetical protein
MGAQNINLEESFGRNVRYYCEELWSLCSTFVDNEGIYVNPFFKGKKIGKRENPFGGRLTIANGDTLTGKIINDQIVKEEAIDLPVPAKTIDQYLAFMAYNHDEDGAFIYDGVNNTLRYVGILENTSKDSKLSKIKYDLKECVPRDFACFDASVAPKAGARTDIAIRVSKAYSETKVVVIKETEYSHLGMGSVIELQEGRVRQMFVLMNEKDYLKSRHDKNASINYYEKERGIVAVHKTYKVENDRVVLDSERTVPKEELFPGKPEVEYIPINSLEKRAAG